MALHMVDDPDGQDDYVDNGGGGGNSSAAVVVVLTWVVYLDFYL